MIQQLKKVPAYFFPDSIHRMHTVLRISTLGRQICQTIHFLAIYSNSANLNDQCNRLKQTNKVVFCAPCTLKSVCLCCS